MIRLFSVWDVPLYAVTKLCHLPWKEAYCVRERSFETYNLCFDMRIAMDVRNW